MRFSNLEKQIRHAIGNNSVNEEDGKVCQGSHEDGSKQMRNLWNKA
ncbi:hypothetical protein Hanom_Chr11g01026731 [Helianthus anomalus]